MRVELYHSPYEHRAGDAYSFWDDNPKKGVEQLKRDKPLMTFGLYGYEEGVSVGADIDFDLFGIQEVGVYQVSKRDFTVEKKNEYWNFPNQWRGEFGFPQPPASSFPM